MRKIYLALILASLLFCGCSALRGYGPDNPRGNAYFSISPNYKYDKNQKIIVMPFEVNGKEAQAEDRGATNMFMIEVMRKGLFTVLDPGVMSEFYEDNAIKPGAPLTKSQLRKLNAEYGVDMVVYGTVNYSYHPAVYRKEDKPAENEKDNYYREGHNVLRNESFKAVWAKTGEVVITSYVDSQDGKSQIYELVYAIEKSL